MSCTGPHQECNKVLGHGTPATMAVAAEPEEAMKRSFTPDQAYFERNIDQIDPALLNNLVESPGFTRQEAMTVLTSIRQNAIDKLSRRVFPDSGALDRAVAAINANVIKHSAQVMTLATRLAAAVGADPRTARQAALGAGYHDGDKDDTNFCYHHLDSANFAGRALRETGLSGDDAEIGGVRGDILRHMPFGNGADPNNFMNKALAGEAATIAQAEADYRPRLRYLMQEALLKSAEDAARVESWLDAHAGDYPTKNGLAEALGREFGGRELSFPKPSGQAGEILHNAVVASGEHLLEVQAGDDGRSLAESYQAADLVWITTRL